MDVSLETRASPDNVHVDFEWQDIPLTGFALPAARPHSIRLHHVGSRLGTDSALIEGSDFVIRVARTAARLRQAGMLIRRMYATKGYRWDAGDEIPEGPSQVTFLMCNTQRAFGTLTLRFESEVGLLADHLYRTEIDGFRASGRVCELAWFAVDPKHGSREMLASLFHLVYVYARVRHRVSNMFIEVNPRHVSFYRRALGFRPAGEQRTCERVGAPAVLLRLDLHHADRQIERYAGTKDPTERSLYPHFLPPQEHQAVCRRMGGGPCSAAGCPLSSRCHAI
jgi:hypothetical protein